MNKDILIIFMELRPDRKQSYNQILINKCIITNRGKFHKGKMQPAKMEGNPDGVVYSEGEGWVSHGSECEFIGGGSKSVILCLLACETVSPNVAQAGFKLMPVMNLTSSRFVLPGGEITIWSALF